MTESNQYEIINRLHKLEKQNRYMKLGGLAIVFLVVTTLLTGARMKPDIFEEIRAKKIVLVNEQGKKVIVMEYVNNVSRIVSFDSNETVRFMLRVDDESSRLTLWDSNQKGRLSLITKDTMASLNMVDSKRKSRLTLLTDDEKASLNMSDSNEMGRFMLTTDDEGSRLFLRDSNEKDLLLLTSSGDNGGGMWMFNKTNENVVKLGVDEYGNGVVGAYNRKGKGKTLKPGP